MPKRNIVIILVSSVIILSLLSTYVNYTLAWWDVGHRELTSRAINYLPDKWKSFFKYYEDFLRETCVWPDTVLAAKAGESYNHYYDSEFPMEKHLKDPSKGRLPWRVAELMNNLTNYIKEENWYKVLETAGILSHYLADSAQPYHTTSDYNPPITSNVSAPGVRPKHALLEGIHAQHIDEIIPNNLNITPTYIDDPFNFMMKFINESYSFLPELNNILLGKNITDPSDDRDWPDIKPILENRSIRAIWLIASMWYTAIVDADAIDKAPDPTQFAKLSIEVSGLKAPEKPMSIFINIKVKDLIGVPTKPDKIIMKINDSIIELKETDLGEYTARLKSDTIKSFSLKIIKVTIAASKSGYESAEFTKTITFPEYGESGGAETQLNTNLYIGIIILVLVLIGVFLLLRKR